MTPEELVFNSMVVSPRGVYIDPSQYYEGVAQQERNRQWNIAKQYMQNPSLPNVFKAIGAAWNALPFNTTSATVNPDMNAGDAPAIGIKMPINPKQLVRFNKSVYPRMFKDLPEDRYAKAVQAANNSIPENYIQYDTRIPGHPEASGTWNPNTHQISIVKGHEDAIGHEARHALDNEWPLSQQERSILKNAYDDTFLEYGSNPSIVTERVTTNYDIRDVLLREAGLSEAAIDVQNKYLESVSASQLYNAMAKANDYSRAYLARMLKNPKYTGNNYEGYAKILKNIKYAMQTIGGISLPLLFTDPQQFYRNKFGK